MAEEQRTTAFLSVAVPSRTVLVLEAIKHAILTGELTPGQPLVETDLAGQLGVSKTPVREALKTLAGAGLVTMLPYKGAVVRSVTTEEARHLYDLRILLEPEALMRSIAGRHDWTVARLALDRAASATDQAERSLANRDFHRELYGGCGNPMLIQILDDLRDQTALVSATAWRRGDDWRPEAAEHRAVLDAATSAVASGSAGLAGAAADLLRLHIRNFMTENFADTTANRHETAEPNTKESIR
ncbi:MAG: GntR family transcriptional regulator [Streptosporangiaceae bacterium]